MPSNKDRLYVTLFGRGGAPKMEGKEDTSKGMRYHAKEVLGPEGYKWAFEEKSCRLLPTAMLLVRVMIAKVENKNRLIQIIRNTPIRPDVPGWNCVGWVQEALQRLEADDKALGTSVLEWTKVRDAAMEYCQKKVDEHRFDGKVTYDMEKVPTFDLLEGKETVV
ncbi:hypothetical protein GMOD_00001642 [Pyrenophora seminiperda CCB06]|uniref:Uncharacterized protein n=1 Tax=Pyrenophora seminiperda CCB06 TaxID=1302712 RepID=A0A3M7LZR8_9PLEO|nr:hypothetical protein GMOD_00001642 [Pyrenophora seminiperda CCB06]